MSIGKRKRKARNLKRQRQQLRPLIYHCPCGERTELELSPREFAEVKARRFVGCDVCEVWALNLDERVWFNLETDVRLPPPALWVYMLDDGGNGDWHISEVVGFPDPRDSLEDVLSRASKHGVVGRVLEGDAPGKMIWEIPHATVEQLAAMDHPKKRAERALH